MNKSRFAAFLAPALAGVCVLVFAATLCSDDLLKASGRSLRPAQAKFIEGKVEALRTSDHRRRLDTIRDLILLDTLAVPFLEKEVERGSNPIPVRCALLTLAEINPSDLVDRLSGIVKGTKKGRDEKALAVMGLGRRGGSREAQLVRKLLRKGNDRLLRMAAAVALGRMGDGESVDALLSVAGQEREERLAVTFLLGAAMAGGEPFTSAVPKLLKENKKLRRSALTLGCAFEGASILVESLMKISARDPDCARSLAVCLGRYRGEEAEAFLAKATTRAGAGEAADAVYSLVASAGERAVPALLRAFGAPSRSATLRAHVLLAAAEGRLADSFAEPARKSLNDASPPVRSAAALALLAFGDRRSLPLLQRALTREKTPAVAGDILLAIGFLGSAQEAGGVEKFADTAPSASLAGTARMVGKVLVGKMDRAILEEHHEKRLSALSARWSYRFRNAFMEMLEYGMDLDSIVRRVGTGDDSSDSSGEGSSVGEPGGGETGGEPGEEGAPPDAPLPGGSPVGDIPGQGGQGGGLPAPGGSYPGGTGRRRAVVYGEKVEWDILHWFKSLHYFPDGVFGVRK
jgi:HEAT repeat protein